MQDAPCRQCITIIAPLRGNSPLELWESLSSSVMVNGLLWGRNARRKYRRAVFFILALNCSSKMDESFTQICGWLVLSVFGRMDYHRGERFTQKILRVLILENLHIVTRRIKKFVKDFEGDSRECIKYEKYLVLVKRRTHENYSISIQIFVETPC